MKRNTAGIRIGITGGIGSGKSHVSHILAQKFGIHVYDCDAEAKRLNTESAEIRQALTTLVGPNVYAPDGSLRRDVLADYLFASDHHAQQVNAIVHPVVANDFRCWSTLQLAVPPHIVAIESAILFESGFDRLVDVVINVIASPDLCLQRAMQRDGASRQAIEQRMARQMSDEERCRRSHYTILNEGDELEMQINEILKLIN